MSSAQQRRETVRQMQARGLSLRRSCALCHIGHSSLRYRPRTLRRLCNQELVVRLRAIARRHPRYGYRRAHALVCREVPGVNVKRVHRLWRQEHLSVPCRRKSGWLKQRVPIRSGVTTSCMIAVPMASG